MPLYPLQFQPLLKPKVWGGRTLEALGKALPPGVPIGESWEVADLPASIPEGRSVIANGPLAGRTLREAIAQHHEAIMGDGRLTPEGGFPLLIKYLDAQQNLSVQVHPDEAYVRDHPEAHLKSEAWVVIRAEPGAVIYKGVQPEVTAEAFRAHIADGTAMRDLVAVPVKTGDCHYLPSGTCHALGAGILVAEVQTPSDTTFRVYDWGRERGPDARELHIDQAMQCIRFGEKLPESPNRSTSISREGVTSTSLVDTEYFSIERVDGEAGAVVDIVPSGLPEIWMMAAGSGKIETPGQAAVDIGSGATTLFPAALQGARLHMTRQSWLLRVSLPSPLKGMIA